MKRAAVFLCQLVALSLIAAAPASDPAVMRRGVKLFTDRDYTLDELPGAVRGLPFLRTSIAKTEFNELMLLVMGSEVELTLLDPNAPVDARTEPPVIITEPGPEFQD